MKLIPNSKGLGLLVSDKKRFFNYFFLYEYVKQVTSWAGPCFLSLGYNMNNLNTGPLAEAPYQISKA